MPVIITLPYYVLPQTGVHSALSPPSPPHHNVEENCLFDPLFKFIRLVNIELVTLLNIFM